MPSSPPYLKLKSTSAFTDQLPDHGSKATKDVSFWIPEYPNGYNWLGMFATPNYNPVASGTSYVVQAVNDNPSNPLLAAPIRFVEIWTCVGNNQGSDLGIYTIQGPPGYVGLGMIAVPNFHNPPKVSDYPDLRCVRADQCERTTAQDLVWDDQGSGAPLDVSVYMLPSLNLASAVIQNGYPNSAMLFDLKPSLFSEMAAKDA